MRRTLFQKTVRAEAIQYTGDNVKEIQEFGVDFKPTRVDGQRCDGLLFISSRDDWVDVKPGQWILEKEGEYFVADDDILWAQYTTKRRMNEAEQRQLRKEAANIAAHACSGSPVASTQFIALSEAIEKYLKGDSVE